MVTTEIREIILRFAAAVAAKGVCVDKIVLYGSYASDAAHEGSDIDIAVVSPGFGKNRFEEGKMLMQLAWRVDPRIEPIPISSESYEQDTWLPLIYEIRQKGIELKAA